MRKATITKKYLINCLKKYLVEYLYRPITVRDIAKCTNIDPTDLFKFFKHAKL